LIERHHAAAAVIITKMPLRYAMIITPLSSDAFFTLR